MTKEAILKEMDALEFELCFEEGLLTRGRIKNRIDVLKEQLKRRD